LKCVVVYFSQTGNTEKIANAIQTGVKRMAGHCDIFKIKEANPKRLHEYDLIGLGSPVFNVENMWSFINNLRFVGGKHVFAFCTHGGSPEFFFPRLVPRLKNRGLVVIGTRDWYGNCYLLHHIDPYPTQGHPDELDLKEAEDYGQEMVQRSWRITAGETGLIPPEPLLPPMPHEINDKNNVINMKSFQTMLKYDKEKCLYPGCRLCMDNCPIDGIDLSLNPPMLAKPCMYCEFCARICPTGAIDIDEWVQAAASGAKNIYSDLLPNLAKAEADGRFRRHLPIEKVKLDTYSYMLHKTHPQWIIGKGVP
jgi:flavodoxin/Fe-S-cluster-containing hydrogenase component 2